MRPLVTLLGLVGVWAAVQHFGAVPDYLLPRPVDVAACLWRQRGLLAGNAAVTLAETLCGLVLGSACGLALALAMVAFATLRRWLMPLVLLSQAVPVFALAPLLVLWFGFGMGSKIVMATLVIFFPVTAATFDGLRRTDPGLLDLARTMDANPALLLLRLRLPAALPVIGAGLRVAAAIAPIGAVIGEWVGASAGLGFVMQNANIRMQSDLMFAALAVLSAMTMALWVAIDRALRWSLAWAPDSDPGVTGR